MTKADKIRQIIKDNPKLSAAEIAKKAGTKLQYVYSVQYLDRKKVKPQKVKKEAPVVEPYRVADLVKEIHELTIVIAYLEHRVKVAEAKHGATV